MKNKNKTYLAQYLNMYINNHENGFNFLNFPVKRQLFSNWLNTCAPMHTHPYTRNHAVYKTYSNQKG